MDKGKRVDINVILKNLNNESAFEKVSQLFKKTHQEAQVLNEYYDYIWAEYGNGAVWELVNKKHSESSSALSKLKILLVDLLAEETKGWKGIPQLIGKTPIDITPLIYEMPNDIAIDFLNDYIKIIDGIIERFEFEKGSRNDTDERKSDTESLINLQLTLTAIRDDAVNSEKEWEEEVRELEEAKAQDRMEMLKVLHKEDVVSVAN